MNITPIIFEVNDQFDGLYTLTINTGSAPLICENLTAYELEERISNEMKQHYRW